MAEIYSQNYWKKKHIPANEKGLEPRNDAYYRTYGSYMSLTCRPNTSGLNQTWWGSFAIERFVPILPCNIQRIWARTNVTAPGSTVNIILFMWDGGADVFVAEILEPGRPIAIYFDQVDVSAIPLGVIDPVLGQGFFLNTNIVNATLLEIGIDYKITERRFIA